MPPQHYIERKGPKRPPRLSSPEEVRAVVRELVDQLKLARAAINVPVPGVDQETLVSNQRQNEQVFWMKYGHAIGCIDALHGCGRIQDGEYDQFRQQIVATLAATVY